MSRVKYAIYMDTYRMFIVTFRQIKWPSTWKGLFQLGEACTHKTKVKMIGKKPDQRIKMNTDGSAIDNLGRIGEGGIIRDQHGKMVWNLLARLMLVQTLNPS